MQEEPKKYSRSFEVPATHWPRVVSTRQVRNSQFFSIFGRLWPRQECPCWPTNFKGGQFLSTNLTFVTWSYITKYFKTHHWIMPRPCLIMFLSKCDQDKNFHVARLVWEVGIFCPLSPLLLRYHISFSVKKHARIILYLSWIMVLVNCDQDTNNWFVLNISCCRVEHRYMWIWPSYLKYYELQTWRFDTTLGNFKSRMYSCGKWKRSFVGFINQWKSIKILNYEST